MIETSKIHNESCLDTMKGMEEGVIDLICCDPPYGYSFMGKDWDKVVMGVEYWQACLRVLKAGAFCFVMASPRQDVLSRQIIRLQDAGFDVGFTSIYWAYASGFPKAGNIGKMVDKRMGAKRESIGEYQFPDGIRRKTDRTPSKKIQQLHGDKNTPITIPSSNEAKALDGSYAGYQPKPAVEVVIVAMKPLSEKTYVDQALKNRKGVTWLDDCRVPFNKNEDLGDVNRFEGLKPYPTNKGWNNNDLEQTPFDISKGRFPANLLVSDGIVDDGEERSSNTRQPTGKENIYDTSKGWNQNQISDTTTRGCNDSGTFSRYFDLDKWWEERIKELPKKVQKSYPFLIVPKAGKSEKNKGCEGEEGKQLSSPMKNHHPTVKPVKLMSYLITLGSRPHDIIYDPFCGSGTTLISAEITRRKWIGSEISKEYHKIAEERIKRELHQLKLF